MHPGAQDPGRVAIVDAASGETVTFGELDAAANRWAHVFRELGLGVGDHVALCLENSPRFLELTWGAHYAGLLYTACSTRLGGAELGYIVDDCDAAVLVLPAAFADRAPALDAATPRVRHRLSLGGPVAGYAPAEERLVASPATPVGEARIAGRDMLYSSGTTGRPKGIVPTAPDAPMESTALLVTPLLQALLGVAPGEAVYLSPAPLYHAAPLRFCMSFHQLGATIVVMERFDAARALALIGEHGVTHTQMVPTMFVRLLRLPAAVRDAASLGTLRAVVHAGAPCPPQVKRQMLDWLGPVVHEYYASTEACGLTWSRPEDWLSHPGTVGRAVVGVAHVVDDDSGTELGPGETGTVWFSDGPAFAYHKDPQRTADVHDARGWATCGDIGHLDADGFLHLTDRRAYTIITGGVNVYPQEAEDILISHPAVLDAAVFGIPSEEWGETVQAVVQPVAMPGDDALAAALRETLDAHCRAQLADVKCPRAIDLRAELPRHETGKLYKRLLRDEYAARTAGRD